MDAIFTPFKNTFHQAGEQLLAAQKQGLAWQKAQLELFEQQSAAAMKIGKAGFEANVELSQNMSKSLVSAFAPKAETAAA